MTEELHRRRGRLGTSAALTLLGLGIPAILAVVALPRIVSAYGVERAGLLALIWAAIGYFGFLDFGIGRAVSRTVAVAASEARYVDLPNILATAWLSLVLASVALTVAVLTLLPAALPLIVPVDSPLYPDALAAFRVTAIALPIVVWSNASRGVLEGLQQFGPAASARLLAGVLTFASPMAVAVVSIDLLPAAWALLLGRLVIAIGLAALAARHVRIPMTTAVWRIKDLREMASFGAWVSVSNLLSPLMTTMDRFVLGALRGPAAIAYYALPVDAVSRISIVPGALATVMFPTFAATSDPRQALRLYRNAERAITIVLLPTIVVGVLFAPELLSLWLGFEFSVQATAVTRWILLGAFFNGLAQVPYALLQGRGRADITAAIHLGEVIPYLGAFGVLATLYGPAGAAAAWTSRMFADFLLLTFAVLKAGELVETQWARSLMLACATPILVVATAQAAPAVRLVAAGISILIASTTAYQLSTEYRRESIHSVG